LLPWGLAGRDRWFFTYHRRDYWLTRVAAMTAAPQTDSPTYMDFPRFRGHLVCGVVWRHRKDGVHAKAISEGVQGGRA
jgi:hypothetical protein